MSPRGYWRLSDSSMDSSPPDSQAILLYRMIGGLPPMSHRFVLLLMALLLISSCAQTGQTRARPPTPRGEGFDVPPEPQKVVEDAAQEASCASDSDCVAASCCHPQSCVLASAKPSCEGIMCTMDCRPGTMDCGQGSCVCRRGRCLAVISSQAVQIS